MATHGITLSKPFCRRSQEGHHLIAGESCERRPGPAQPRGIPAKAGRVAQPPSGRLWPTWCGGS
jgi:hypothetical protein